MAEKSWEDKTDATLARIETQIDNGDKQTGFALDFRERVVTSLAKIETCLDQNEKDHNEIKLNLKELKDCTDKIPLMEIGLNNHLRTHETALEHKRMRIKSLYYPVLVILVIAILGILSRLVLHVF